MEQSTLNIETCTTCKDNITMKGTVYILNKPHCIPCYQKLEEEKIRKQMEMID